MPSLINAVREQQRAWARRKSIKVDEEGYTLAVEQNLYQPLSPCAKAEFQQGDGAELGTGGQRGKMRALHSSSALVCNAFDYWRGRNTSALAQALSVPAPICSIAFERKFPTGLSGKAPNLDVVIQPATGPALAIESKFLEPYSKHRAKARFGAKYLVGEPGLWHQRGFTGCQAMATALGEKGSAKTWLDVEQLLKHVLGLSRAGRDWELLYLWYASKSEAAEEHAAEIDRFARCVAGDGIGFRSMTYQELFRRLKRAAKQSDSAYIQYLEERYFPDLGETLD